jgi:hypothetical protein
MPLSSSGTIFGPGTAVRAPMCALVGNGFSVMIVAIGSALAGTRLHGFLRPRLPH